MKFRDIFDLKQIIFAVVLMGIMLLFAVNQSNNTVKIKFQDEAVRITSSEYNMEIEYDEVAAVSLEALAEPGEKLENGYDNEILRSGKWENETWGEYYICVDLDVSNCIVVTLEDGRTMVFSRKSDKETTELYNELQTYVKSAQ